MPEPPIEMSELDFIKLTNNHAEFCRKLALLGIDAPNVKDYAKYICKMWFSLGSQHLAEANKLKGRGCPRAVFSRTYYSAYNISKAVRYMAKGFVSLKGDDHGKASTELPDDFPNVAHWSAIISKLYENRLIADYDNWNTSNFTLRPAQAIQDATTFRAAALQFLNEKWNLAL